jgi:Ca2+:H+ antiporter
MATMSTTGTRTFVRSDYIIIGGGAAAVVLAALTRFAGGGDVVAFLCAAVAVTFLASLVGRSVEQLGDRFGPGATGVLQSALGNLPELFIALFALKAGLVDVVKAALIGSILANLLLVLGLCFVVGGLKHGTQKLDSERARSIIVLMVLSVAALVLPSLAHFLHISDAFAGLVIVAIAGNAIENVVGVQLAAKNRSEYAFSVVINSPMQIALVLAPVLVILSQALGFAALTLVFSPMLIVSVAIAVILSAFITFDGESNWLEGAALIAVYVIIAASFWWG